MHRPIWLPSLLLLFLSCPLPLAAQVPGPDLLRFAARDAQGRPAGWSGDPAATVSVDSVVRRSAPFAARLDLPVGGEADASWLTVELPLTFAADTLELRGWLRTDAVQGFAGLMLRQEVPGGTVRFEGMQERQLAGTTEWAHYTIRVAVHAHARKVHLGAMLVGSGTVWVDDLEFLVDGRPVSEAPARAQAVSGVEADHEFDAGSRVVAGTLTPQQVEHVALLGRVWGFVKYHHPRVTGGHVNWDYELFRVLPSVLAAPDRVAAARTLSDWLAKLGDPAPCSPCAKPPSDPHLPADIGWIRDGALLGDPLSARLQRIYRDRHAAGEQYFVGQIAGDGNPDFAAEAQYALHREPDAGYRLLALFRFWNIIEYWFPYRDVIGEDWRGVLQEFVPRIVAADDAAAYRLELMRLTARVHDTHANVWGELHLRPPVGPAQLPVSVRFIEGRAVVTGYTHAELGPASGLQRGDVIERLDGASIDSLVTAWRPLYAASNEPTRLRDIAASLTQGVEGPVRVSVVRAGRALTVDARRAATTTLDIPMIETHDLPGETFQRLSDEVAYLKLSSVEGAKAAEYMEKAAGAKVLVIDIRNYPSDFMVFELGSRLVSERTEFARFTVGDLANPGAFLWTPSLALTPAEPRFAGRVVILVDETSQSSAEYTAMAFRAAPNAIVVGSTTAGADGNISPIPLPGGTRGMISGIGVFYPDKRPTQRVGIVPDLEVRPTLTGLLAGRDEVLEAGVSRALGRAWRMPAR